MATAQRHSVAIESTMICFYDAVELVFGKTFFKFRYLLGR